MKIVPKRSFLLLAALAASAMGTPLIASAFNPMEWFLKNAVEDRVEDIVRDATSEAVKEAIKNAVVGDKTDTNDKKSAKAKANQPKATKAKQPDPVLGVVSGRDYEALPLNGDFRFPVPAETKLEQLKIGERGGYIDRFGSEWLPYRVNGKVVAWQSILSKRGRLRMAWAVKDKPYFVVGRDGKRIDPGAGN